MPEDYFLRCRILARIRRFFRPTFRRPFPVFFVPTESLLLLPGIAYLESPKFEPPHTATERPSIDRRPNTDNRPRNDPGSG